MATTGVVSMMLVRWGTNTKVRNVTPLTPITSKYGPTKPTQVKPQWTRPHVPLSPNATHVAPDLW